jgi:thiol-disulfide isomerase/thioredoxin
MLKIAFNMIVFNGDYVLEEVLRAVYPFAYQILVAEGPVTYWQQQGYTCSDDNTNEILHYFPDPDKKIVIHNGQYAEKHEQAQAALANIKPNADYLWNLDCDEVFKESDLKRLIDMLGKDRPASVGFPSKSFFGGFADTMGGFEANAEFRRVLKYEPGAVWASHRPPCLEYHPDTLLPSQAHVSAADNKRVDLFMYHYSYVFPKQVKEKVQYYKAAVSQDNCIDNWFENVYAPWVMAEYWGKSRQEVEDRYNGVHEFKPEVRGPCFTQPWRGQHPRVIHDAMPRLSKKWAEQVEKYVLSMEDL